MIKKAPLIDSDQSLCVAGQAETFSFYLFMLKTFVAFYFVYFTAQLVGSQD